MHFGSVVDALAAGLAAAHLQRSAVEPIELTGGVCGPNRWQAEDSLRTTAHLVASPHIAGYQLVAYVADPSGRLPDSIPRGIPDRRPTLLWFAVADPITSTDSARAAHMRAELSFVRGDVPRTMWSTLDPFVPPLDSLTRWAMERMNRTRNPAEDRPRLPLTLRLGADGRVSADTVLLRDGQRLRVRLTREDTIALSKSR